MVIPRKVPKKKVPKKSVAAAASAADLSSGNGCEKVVGKSDVATYISLDVEMVISNVQGLRDKMLEEISGAGKIELDGGEIEHIDGTGLQLLVALVREAEANKTTISWKAASDVLQNNARQLGLTAVLGLDKLSGAA